MRCSTLLPLLTLASFGIHAESNGDISLVGRPTPFGNQLFNCDEESDYGYPSPGYDVYVIHDNSSLWVSGNASREGEGGLNVFGDPIREFTLEECEELLNQLAALTEIHMPNVAGDTSQCTTFPIDFGEAECVVLGPKKRTAIRTKASATARYPDVLEYDQSGTKNGTLLSPRDRYEWVPYGPISGFVDWNDRQTYRKDADNLVNFYCGYDNSSGTITYRLDAFNTALDCALNAGYDKSPHCCEESWEVTTTTTTTPPPKKECAANCGSAPLGGGECDDSDENVCTKCNNDRFLATGTDPVTRKRFGRCVVSLACKNREVQSGKLKGMPCKCEDREFCQYCIRSVNGDVCKRCKKGRYLLNDKCVESCPPHMTQAGVSTYGRTCQSPFACVGGRSVGLPTQIICKCSLPGNLPRSDCLSCEFQAGQYGQHCNVCKNNKYLGYYSKVCKEDCSEDMAKDNNIIAYKVGGYRGECRKPFTCSDRKDENGVKCKCSSAVGKNDCKVCDWGLNGNVCRMCTNNKYLKHGVCVSRCGIGYMGLGQNRDGRECQRVRGTTTTTETSSSTTPEPEPKTPRTKQRATTTTSTTRRTTSTVAATTTTTPEPKTKPGSSSSTTPEPRMTKPRMTTTTPRRTTTVEPTTTTTPVPDTKDKPTTTTRRTTSTPNPRATTTTTPEPETKPQPSTTDRPTTTTVQPATTTTPEAPTKPKATTTTTPEPETKPQPTSTDRRTSTVEPITTTTTPEPQTPTMKPKPSTSAGGTTRRPRSTRTPRRE